MAAHLPASVAMRDAANMTCTPALQVDVDQRRRRPGRLRRRFLSSDKDAIARAPRPAAGVTPAVTTKRAGKCRPHFALRACAQSVITQSMIALISASLAADFGWPLPDATFAAAAPA